MRIARACSVYGVGIAVLHVRKAITLDEWLMLAGQVLDVADSCSGMNPM